MASGHPPKFVYLISVQNFSAAAPPLDVVRCAVVLFSASEEAKKFHFLTISANLQFSPQCCACGKKGLGSQSRNSCKVLLAFLRQGFVLWGEGGERGSETGDMSRPAMFEGGRM